MGFTLSNSLLIGLAGFFLSASLAQDCTPRKASNSYETMNFKEICGEKFPAGSPGFDRPIACSTKAIHPPLAFSISNKAFQCNKWCVHSLESDVAWMWDPSQGCWSENPGCLNFAEEKAFAQKVKSSLCPDCVPIVKSSDLSVAVVKQKCPSYTENSVPSYHINKACEWDGPVEDLGLTLANGGYVGCDKWCVYSVRTPSEVAYKWNPSQKCWSIQNNCISSYPSERQAVEAIKAKFCQPTCTAVRAASDLSVDVVKMKCPSYAPTSHPQFHNNKLCRTLEADPELGEALANHAYSSCTAWCLFSLRRPSTMSWKWMPDRLCWNENADCRSIQTEVAAAQALSASACIPPVLPTKDTQPQQQPAQQQTQTTQPQQDQQQQQQEELRRQQEEQKRQQEEQRRQQEEQQKRQQEEEEARKRQQEAERQQELQRQETERQEQERRRQEEEQRARQAEEERVRREQEEKARQEEEQRKLREALEQQNLQQQEQQQQQQQPQEQQPEQTAEQAQRQQLEEARQQALKRRQEIADQLQQQRMANEKPEQQQQPQQEEQKPQQMSEEEKKRREEKYRADERHRKLRAEDMMRRAQEANRRENEEKLKEKERQKKQAHSEESPRSWRTQHTTRTKDPADSFKLFGGLFLVFVAIAILAFFTKEPAKPKNT